MNKDDIDFTGQQPINGTEKWCALVNDKYSDALHSFLLKNKIKFFIIQDTLPNLDAFYLDLQTPEETVNKLIDEFLAQ